MNIEEYIASGMIESYVLGATTAEENAELERLLSIYPEIQEELLASQRALEQYLMQFSKEPPAGLKAKIIGQLNELKNDLPSGKQKYLSPVSEKSKKAPASSLGMAALYLLLALSLGLNVFLYYSQQTLQDSQSKTEENIKSLEKQLQSREEQYAALSRSMEIINDPTNVVVRLNGLPDFQEASATLYWDNSSKQVYLQVKNLPPAPAGMQYQLWAIKEKNIQDAGLIGKGKNPALIHTMKVINEADTFAITLEKEGGLPQPQGIMYVKGKV